MGWDVVKSHPSGEKIYYHVLSHQWDLGAKQQNCCVFSTASQSVRLLWLHSPNNKFRCTRSILEVFLLGERSLFCVPATSDMKMQASLRRIRVRNESHYLHEHTVIVQQSSTEKCNYAMFNSHRAAVELGRQLQMLCLHELYRKILCIVQLHHKYFIRLIKVIFSETFLFSISQAARLLFIA